MRIYFPEVAKAKVAKAKTPKKLQTAEDILNESEAKCWEFREKAIRDMLRAAIRIDEWTLKTLRIQARKRRLAADRLKSKKTRTILIE